MNQQEQQEQEPDQQEQLGSLYLSAYAAGLGNLSQLPEDHDPLAAHNMHAAGVFAVARAADRAAGWRAVHAFTRAGTFVTPDMLDDELVDMAEKTARTYAQVLDARGSGTTHDLQHSTEAVTDLLMVIAALRAALGLSETPTAADIDAARTLSDVTTATHDALRLHLFTVHCNLAALTHTDKDALDDHEHEHHGPGGLRHHPFDNLDWPRPVLEERLAELDDDQPAARQRASEMIAGITGRVAVS